MNWWRKGAEVEHWVNVAAGCEYQGDDDWLALPAGHKPDCAWRQAREFIERERA